MASKNKSRLQNQPEDQRLLERHIKHLGLYARVAKLMDVNPSYVSRVARGVRRSEKVRRVLMQELRRIERPAR